jgi:ribosome recycling factor
MTLAPIRREHSGALPRIKTGIYKESTSLRQIVFRVYLVTRTGPLPKASFATPNPANTMDPDEILLEAEDQMDKVIAHLTHDFSTLHTGKASPSMVDAVMVYVNSYGTTSKLREISAITTPDARTIQIQPWDRNTLKDIEKAIQTANIGLNPAIQGSIIRISVPDLSGERRKELVKVSSTMAEQARVSIRGRRHEALEPLKKAKTASKISEDDYKNYEKQVQDLHDKYIEKIAQMLASKEKDLTAV